MIPIVGGCSRIAYQNPVLQNSNDSLLSIFSLGDGNNYNATLAEELQAKKHKKKKKKEIR